MFYVVAFYLLFAIFFHAYAARFSPLLIVQKSCLRELARLYFSLWDKLHTTSLSKAMPFNFPH